MCSSNVNKTFIINLFLDMMCQKKVKKDNIELPVLYIEIEFFADGNLDLILYNILCTIFKKIIFKNTIYKHVSFSCVDQKKNNNFVLIFTQRGSLFLMLKNGQNFFMKNFSLTLLLE